MGQFTDSELITKAEVILNATEAGENTATRVANMYIDVIDSKFNKLDPIARPYKVFSANLTQVGKNDQQETLTEGQLIKGVTYYISGSTGADFSNLGAPNNDVGTYFISTKTEPPISWGSNGAVSYRDGLPKCVVFENTLDSIWFDFDETADGSFILKSNNFINSEMWVSIAHSIYQINGFTTYVNDVDKVYILTYDANWSAVNGSLKNTSLEIRVYNS